MFSQGQGNSITGNSWVRLGYFRFGVQFSSDIERDFYLHLHLGCVLQGEAFPRLLFFPFEDGGRVTHMDCLV